LRWTTEANVNRTGESERGKSCQAGDSGKENVEEVHVDSLGVGLRDEVEMFDGFSSIIVRLVWRDEG
jgi:hypothetical protein